MTGPNDNGWADKMAAEEPAAREKWPAGTVYEPHNGVDSDANLHYADLLAEPDRDSDPMRNWTPDPEPVPGADTTSEA